MNHYGARFIFRSGDNPSRNMLLVLKDVATNSVFVSLENLTRTRGLYAYFNRSCSNIEYHLTEASGKTVLLLFIDEYNFFL